MSYYGHTKTRGGKSGSPTQAINYLTDDHDTKRLATCSRDEVDYLAKAIDYIAKDNPDYKRDLQRGRVELTGHGTCKRATDEKAMRRSFNESCKSEHKLAKTGYKSHVLTMPKELSIIAETNPKVARASIKKAIDQALKAAYPDKEISAVSSIHTRNNLAGIHFHTHVLVGKFATDKKTKKRRSLNNSKFMGGDARESKVLRESWTKSINKELERHLGIKIEPEGKSVRVLFPNGKELNQINTPSRREVELAIAPQVRYMTKEGMERTRTFGLTKMDARIYEIASQKNKGWNPERFLNTFPKQAKYADRYDRRVETLKSMGYLNTSGHITATFETHARAKWGERPELAQIKMDMEQKQDKNIQQRLTNLGLSKTELEETRQAEAPIVTHEYRELLKAELELSKLEKERKRAVLYESGYIFSSAYMKDNWQIEELKKKIVDLELKAEESLTSRNTKSPIEEINERIRQSEAMKRRMGELEKMKDTELKSKPERANYIEKFYSAKTDRINQTLERIEADILNKKAACHAIALRKDKYLVPENLKLFGNEIIRINSRAMAMGLSIPLSRDLLEGFSRNGLQSAIADDPALKQLGQAGMQWVRLPITAVKLCLGNVRELACSLGLSLGR